MRIHGIAAILKRLGATNAGVAATEFAIVLPFLLGAGLMGLDLANRAIVQMQVSQLAMHIADNASRIGDTATLQDRTIYESDLNDLFLGEEVWAFADEAVVFVEVAYDYQSLVGATFGISSEVTATASFTVRDDRDLSQIYQRDPADPEPIARCSVFGDAESLRS